MATFLCAHCGYSQTTSNDYIGRKATCPECREHSRVTPEPPPVAAPPAKELETPAEFATSSSSHVVLPSRHCSYCSLAISPHAAFCPRCGEPNAARYSAVSSAGDVIRPSRNALHPAVAGLLSFLLIGLGQMVMGQVGKGVVMLVVALILGVLTGCFACLITFPVSVIDACLIASKLRSGQAVGKWEFF